MDKLYEEIIKGVNDTKEKDDCDKVIYESIEKLKSV